MSEKEPDKAVTFREMLAELEHKQWAHWTRYMLDNLTPENIERWKRQIETPYDELPEAEKDSDREWADKVLFLAVDALDAEKSEKRRERREKVMEALKGAEK